MKCFHNKYVYTPPKTKSILIFHNIIRLRSFPPNNKMSIIKEFTQMENAHFIKLFKLEKDKYGASRSVSGGERSEQKCSKHILNPYSEKYENGNIYRGEHNHLGQKHGLGIMYYANGDILQAKWKNDTANGSGYFISQNGTELIGIWKNNLLHGTKNKIRYPSGSEYEGNTKYGLANGIGILTTQENDIFHGLWANNELNGYTNISYQDGNKYQGFMCNNEKCGQGIYLWTNGGVYNGNWYKDELHGEGVLQTHGKVYHGPWELGQQL